MGRCVKRARSQTSSKHIKHDSNLGHEIHVCHAKGNERLSSRNFSSGTSGFQTAMSIHREAKISDQYEILNYIGQGTYANVCFSDQGCTRSGRFIRQETLRVAYMH